METNNNFELKDESVYPNDEILKRILGNAYTAYRELLKLHDSNRMAYEWKYYHDGKTWLCKVQKNKRTIVWMSAWRGYIQAVIYFPEKYLEQVYKLDISEEQKEKIRQTKNTGKSRPCIFKISSEDVPEDFPKIMQFKIIAK